MTTSEYAELMIRGTDLWEDPWTPSDIEIRARALPAAAVYAGGGLWAAFVAATCWWAYEFVMAAGPAVVAQIN